MKVYVVEECFPYDGCAVEGVFSTKEKADAYAARKSNGNDNWLVTEIELDKEQD